VRPFPAPGPTLQCAFDDLHLAATGTDDQVAVLGDLADLADLPRPWDPATCRDPDLRRELWAWLDAVVTWLMTEYTWDVVDAVIPACWPQHPHLVHELAVLADQRRRAGAAFTSDALEEWHRYALPAFTDRTRARCGEHCEQGHQPWPVAGRYARHQADARRVTRSTTLAHDLDAVSWAGSVVR
jgi:hypothetical protein